VGKSAGGDGIVASVLSFRKVCDYRGNVGNGPGTWQLRALPGAPAALLELRRASIGKSGNL